MGKYSQRQHFYLGNIRLHQGYRDHESRRKMLTTWHFVLPNLLNIACGSLTEEKSCQRKELLNARFLCKNRFPNAVPYFALHSYIRKTLPVLCTAQKQRETMSRPLDLKEWILALLSPHSCAGIDLEICLFATASTKKPLPNFQGEGTYETGRSGV